jgi:mRNA interferase HicA
MGGRKEGIGATGKSRAWKGFSASGLLLEDENQVDSGCVSLDFISTFAYILGVKSSEFKRWLTAQGAVFAPAKGSHFHVYLNGKQSIVPLHQKDIPTGTVEAIKKQLGLKQ